MASGSINLTSSKAWAGRIDWESTPDIASNSSYVSVTVYTWKTDGYATSGSGSFSGSVTVAGSTKSFSYLQENKSGESNRGTWGFTVYHNDDGTKSISIGASISGPGSTSLSGVTLSGSKTVTLDQIARASTFSATDAAIGSTSQITIIRKATTITHRIKVTFGSLVGYITNTGGWSTSVATISGTSVGFVIPDDFYYQIPNATEGDCSMVLYTMYGSTVVATSSPITVHITTVESRCNPTISVTKNTSLSDDASALTGDSNKYIRHYSKVVYDMTRSARFGASITRIWVDIPSTLSGTRFTFDPISADTFTFWAQDSRGYRNSTTVTLSLVSYVDLTNNATAGRPNPTDGSAFISFSGDYFNQSFGRVNNTLSIKYRITYPDGSQSALTSVTPSINENSYSAYVSFTGFDYQNSYEVYVEVTDRIKTVTKNITIKQGIPVFDWGKNDFQFHVPVYINGEQVIPGGSGELDLDKVYPIGSIYMCVGDIDPNIDFGGRWIKYDGRLSLSGGAYLDVSIWKRVSETIDPTYSVSAVSGAQYGFTVNSAGYYQSNNAGVDSSYAICRIDFNTQGKTMYLDCINFGESTYDYGLIGAVGVELTLSSSADSNVLKSFNNSHSLDPVTVTVGNYGSEDKFLYVKYIKDSSVSNQPDSIQFKVRFE